MNKFQEKYIPAKFRELRIDERFGGTDNLTKVLRDKGRTDINSTIHIEPIRGRHQSRRAHPDIFQVVLPNDDRLLTTWSGNTLMGKAKAHVSSKTGVVTILNSICSGDNENRTFSELFNSRMHRNLTDFPFAEQRIGDYAAVPGFQFTCEGSSITPINPSTDWRIKTNRVISMRVRKKLREVAEVVEGKSELIMGLYPGGGNEKRKRMSERVHALTRNAELASSVSYYPPIVQSFTRPRDLVDKRFGGATPHDGLILKLRESSGGTSVIDTINGDLNHELLALLIAQSHTNWGQAALISLAPLFIAARGGYSLTKVEK